MSSWVVCKHRALIYNTFSIFGRTWSACTASRARSVQIPFHTYPWRQVPRWTGWVHLKGDKSRHDSWDASAISSVMILLLVLFLLYLFYQLSWSFLYSSLEFSCYLQNLLIFCAFRCRVLQVIPLTSWMQWGITCVVVLKRAKKCGYQVPSKCQDAPRCDKLERTLQIPIRFWCSF